MLEILAIIFLGKKNAANAVARGREPGGFVALTIAIWLGMELIGAIIGKALGLGLGAYALALLFAVGGGILSYYITKNCKQGMASSDSDGSALEGLVQKKETVVPAKNNRAVYAGLLFIVGWMLLIFMQGLSTMFNGQSGAIFVTLLYCPEASYFIVSAVWAVAVYLVVQKGWQYKVIAGVFGLIGAFLYACSGYAEVLYMRTLGAFGLGDVLDFRNVGIISAFKSTLLMVCIILAAAVLSGYFLHKKTARAKAVSNGGIVAGVMLLYNLIRLGIQYKGYLIKLGFLRSAQQILPLIGESLCLFLVVVMLFELCNMRSQTVKLRGIGLVWAWIAAVGCFLGMAVPLNVIVSNMHYLAYTVQMLLCLVACVGYVLMITKRRIGLYVVVIGAGLLLLGQFFDSFTGFLFSRRLYLSLFLGSILGAVNPLFGWLAVKAADTKNGINEIDV